MSMVHTLVVHQNLLGVFQNIDAWVSPLSPHKSEICWGQAQASLFTNPGNSLVVSWLGLYTSTAATAGNMGSVPGWETRILLAAWYSKKERKEKKKILLMLPKALYSKEQSWFWAPHIPGVSVVPLVPVL